MPKYLCMSESVTALVISICKSLKRQPIKSKLFFFLTKLYFPYCYFLT